MNRNNAISALPYYTYILQCEHEKLYVGSCEDLERRFKAHLLGQGADFTRRHKPMSIAYSEIFNSRAEAMKREAQIKKWSRAKKLALIDRNATQLKRLSISRDHSD